MQEQRQDHLMDKDGRGGGTALLELIDRALDKGVLMEGYVRVPVFGIDVLTLDVRALVASFDKYLEYADAIAQTARIVEMEAVDQELLPPEQPASADI